MGRHSLLKPAPAGPSRRSFFRRSGASALALAGAAVAPVGALAQPAPRGPFQHGVASGDPLADRVILWTRVTPGRVTRETIPVRWEVARDAAFADVVARGLARTNASRDFTVKVDPAGLAPATTYYYRFLSLGRASPVGRTRTLPVGATPRLRIAVASCSNHAAGLFNAYRRIAGRADLDLVVHLGDYFYEYGPDEFGSLRAPEPPRETVTLADYRARHAQYKRDADLQEAHRQHPFACVWDDHEVTNDSWKDGAQNHTEGTEGTWPVRVNEALQAYYEWMPVRQPDPADPRILQRSFRLGDLAELAMLETRLQARSQQLPATVATPFGPGFTQTGAFLDASRTLLGDTQEAELARRLREANTAWKILGQQVMFAPLKIVPAPRAAGGGVFANPDQWDGYQPARDRIFDLLRGSAERPPVNDVIVLTGDIHSGWAADLTPDPNNPNVGAGGYDPATGAGSLAVEFVCTSISSPGLADPSGTITGLLRSVNPHFKHIDLNRRGYTLLDLTPERVVAEWWVVDTVESPSANETFTVAFEVRRGTNRLVPSARTEPRRGAPALAPAVRDDA